MQIAWKEKMKEPHSKINIFGMEGTEMRNKRHVEFVKKIRLPEEEKTKENGKTKGTQNIQINKMTKQEETELQKELERRFNELFGTVEED